jgi:hypothetical protein
MILDFCTGGFSKQIDDFGEKCLLKTRPYSWLLSKDK